MKKKKVTKKATSKAVSRAKAAKKTKKKATSTKKSTTKKVKKVATKKVASKPKKAAKVAKPNKIAKPAKKVAAKAKPTKKPPMKPKKLKKVEEPEAIMDAPQQLEEKVARDAVRNAQHSTLDLIKAAAMKAMANRKVEEKDEDDSNYMEVLAPRRRGRPPKSARYTKKDSNVYVPEFDGLQELSDQQKQKSNDTSEPEPYYNDNETIDNWNDDDIPMAKTWKEESIEF